MEGAEKLKIEKFILETNASESTSVRFSPLLRQMLAASGPIVYLFCGGTTAGYSAILLPQLEDENSTITITTEEASWIASMAALPMAFGCILSGILLERIGRRMTEIISAAPFIVGWLLIGAAINYEMLLIGRFLTGFAVGLTGPVSSVYIAETSAPKYRGFLLSTISLAIALGLFSSHLLGIFLSWQAVAYICMVLPIACIALLVLVPESPTWLVNRREIKKAEDAFVWFRGDSLVATEELIAMLEKQASSVAAKEKFAWSQCKNKEFWKPLLVMNVFFTAMQFAGVNAIAFYSVSIMQDAVGEGMDKYLAMMIIDTIRLIMSVAACVLVRKFGRRPLTNISTFGTALSLFGLSGFMYVSSIYPEYSNYSFIPIGCLVGYIVFVSVGLVPLPWTMLGEVFPRNMKGAGSSVSTLVSFLGLFLIIKTNPTMNMLLKPYGTFLFYGCSSLIGGVILYFYLPETKGKTLQQIEEHFKYKRRTNHTDVIS